jgi:superfamily II DNA/RNA helicase
MTQVLHIRGKILVEEMKVEEMKEIALFSFRVEHLVLDEADKLFEMGFVEQIDGIVAACSKPDVQRSLFSATLPETVEELARSIMHDPVRMVVGER